MDSDLPTEKDTVLEDFFMDLKKNEDKIVVLRDRTNGHQLVAMEDYIKWINDHIQKAARPIRRVEIVKLHHNAMEFAMTLKELHLKT
eukprot:15366717-Ditylum_brightwellii.AAC.1